MSDALKNPPYTPERIVLSGEGLRRMDTEDFRLFVQQLGRLGIEVEEVPLKEKETYHAAEREQNPQAIYKKDFVLSAIKHDLSRVNVGRTWSVLTTPWKKYHQVLDKLANSGNLYSWERDVLDKPSWQRELCIAKNELSRQNVQSAYHSHLLEDLDGMGPRYTELVGVVLSDLEEQDLID